MADRPIREQLYPPIEPYQSGMLKLDRIHEMYWEQSGCPGGVPVLFLHGGPGAGATAVHRRFFDPSTYRVVIYDQRGAGRSRPRGALEDNTTQHLIEDIEELRKHLEIEKFLLFGGSWGSTLALAYAQAYPDRCIGLVLRGIFLGTSQEIEWFLYGMRNVFPEAWRDFVDLLPEAERNALLPNYYRLLTSDDPADYLPAARTWSRYEGACSTLLPSPETVAAFGEEDIAYALARIETHYFVNSCFLDEDQLLAGVRKIQHLPCTIIQGRYDMICPIATAESLHRAWEGSEFVIVPDAGHSAMDAGIRAALVRSTELFKRQLGDRAAEPCARSVPV